jgi:hypothetical protein
LGRVGQGIVLGRELVHVGIAVVAYHKSLFGIEHAKALAHVVDGGIQHQFLLLQRGLRAFDQSLRLRKLADDFLKCVGSVGKAAIRKYPDQTHPQHRQRHAGNRQGKDGRRQRQMVRGPARVRNNLLRGHRREMMRDNGEGQEQCGDNRSPSRTSA